MKDYSKIRGELDGILSERIMILDGAMGTRIQSFSLGEDDFRGGRFATHPVPIAGNNDLLSLTRPDIIEGIHREYLDAGVDIIETNTFNSNALSQADYGLAEIVGELNMESARLACRAAERYVAENPGRRVFVAGSIGPTGKTCSMSPDVNDPGFRDVCFDDLEKIYFQAARALVEGGVDILLLETVFDTLNAKAAISALSRLNDELGVRVPLMISATISDASGRTLSGQTIEAFVNSVSHAENLLSLGLNCALGARGMRPHIEELSGCATVHVSAHPNAGLPNAFGKYDQSPAEMAELVADFATSGFVNILGGCCGSTPEHIAAIARAVADIAPRRKLPDRRRCCRLSGLEPLNISPEMNFVNIGERTNVSGSRKFLRLIKEKNHEEALIIAREQVENGAQIIDVNMDDGMLEGADEMQRFLNLSASEPEISRVPVMVDSSDFEVIVAGLKCLQGRGIVNSISLKEGEAEFLRKARTVKRLGAAVLVMCFDEHGQADTLERRVAVARRSIELLTGKCGYLPEQIVIDPNVFAIGTGIEEHDNYARDFIEAISNIKSENPGVLVSGGVSNMSFSFRGNDAIREVMHSVFLYHAIAKGMDMGIVNPGQLTVYDEIPEDIRGIVEDAVFNTSPGASEKLLKLAENIQFRGKRQEQDNSWREGSADERIMHALVKGFADHIESDVEECRLRDPEHPVAVIEDSLMKGIEKVGQLFGAGKMFLPQVVKSARVMKKAVAYLMPYIEAKRSGEKLSTSAGKIVLATVKGDVHDIGKNIAAVVLRCNNYEVVDLGVMVPCERILDAARSENADIVGLSGLITPSLEEMVHVAAEMQRGNLHIPLLVGGAATSKLHLAVKIEPVRKNGPCIYVPDASRGVSIVNSLMNKALRDKFINAESDECKKLRNSHGKAERNMIPLEDARKNRYAPDFNSHPPAEPRKIGTWTITDQSIDELVPLIDWNPFFSAWEIKGRYPDVLDDPTKGEEARKLHNDALEMLKDIALHGYLKGKAVYGIFPACSKDDDVLLFSHKDPAIQSSTLHFLRDQKARKNGVANLALPDFLLPCGSSRQDHIGLFALTTGIGADEQAKIFSDAGDDYSAIMLATLANCLAEAFAEHLHSIVCRDVWACSANSSPTGIRPAPGYPCCPDHSLKNNIFDILDATRNIGVTLSETTSMSPSASVAGFYFTHKQSSYFNIAHVAMDQLEDYARRSKTDTADAAKKLAHLL